MKRKIKRTVITVLVILFVLMLIPIPLRLKDGGTVTYQAVLYSVSNVKRIGTEHEYGCDYIEYRDVGTVVKILGIEVFNNVQRIY